MFNFFLPQSSNQSIQNLRFYQETITLLLEQVNKLNGLDKLIVIFELQNYKRKIIELSLEKEQQELNYDDFEQNYQIDEMDSQFYEKIIVKALNAKFQNNHCLNMMIFQAKLMIESQNQSILSHDQFEKQQSFLNMQKHLKSLPLPRDLFKQLNNRKIIPQNRKEECLQILKNLEILSIEYLEIMIKIIETYQQQAQQNPQNEELILHLICLKILIFLAKTVTNQFNESPTQLTIQEIEFLNEMCYICVSSIQKEDQKIRLIEIKNLKQLAIVYMVFAKMLTKNFQQSPEKNQEFQIALEIYNRIVFLLNESKNEFSNNLAYQEFKLRTLKDIKLFFERDQDKIEFQELICLTLEQICEEKLQILNFCYLGIDQFNKVNEIEELLNFLDKDEVQVLQWILTAYEKMLEISDQDQEFFQKNDKKVFYQECFLKIAQICEKIAKQQQSLQKKEDYLNKTLNYYERAQRIDQTNFEIKTNRLKTIVQVPVELGIEKTWNKYYDQALDALKEGLNLKLFDQFIQNEFEPILLRFSEQQQLYFAKELFQILNYIFCRDKNQYENLFKMKAQILEKIGDLIKNEEQLFYYNESIIAIDLTIDFENPNQKFIMNKLNLLIKSKRNLEALSVAKQFMKFKDFFEVQKQCEQLLVDQSFFRLAHLVSRQKKQNNRNFNYNVKALQNNL